MDRDHVSINIKDDESWELILANQQLRTAAKEGDVPKFIKALENYAAKERVSLCDIIHIEGPSGNSLLHVAAGVENAGILQALLAFIPDKQLAANANCRGDTALHIAARSGSIKTAELLLGRNMTVDSVNDAGNTALHEAVKSCDDKLTHLLLSRGSNLVYKKNNESKCPLYLAVETGDLKILRLLMAVMEEHELLPFQMEGMSPVHGAVIYQRIEMLKEMSKQKKALFYLRDAGGGTPLHLAAYMNYIDGVKFFIEKFPSCAFEGDEEGYLPIHVACKMGHLETIKELLQHWSHPEELLNLKEGQNILHVAAKYGMALVVKYILSEPKLEMLINAKDRKGNTPLHVATLHWQPEALLPLTRNDEIDLKLENNDHLTALDIVDEQIKKIDPPLLENITRIILVSARAPRSEDKAICQPKDLGSVRDTGSPDLDRLKDAANTRMVVATLIAGMAFAASLSVPGGFNGSKPDAGIATLLNKPMYNVFVICNMVAMFSSIITVVILLWAKINDPHGVQYAIKTARPVLLIAIATMSMAFTAGVYVTVSKHTWIAIAVLTIGITAFIVILSLYVGLVVPVGYNCCLVPFFADCIIKASISISRSGTKRRTIRPARSVKPDKKPPQPKDPSGDKECSWTGCCGLCYTCCCFCCGGADELVCEDVL